METASLRPVCVQLVACSVFQPALEYLSRRGRLPKATITYMPSHLHLRVDELQRQLAETVEGLKRKSQSIVLLYGTCFPDIDRFCTSLGIYRLRGEHCFEMMLGSERYRALLEEAAGTYFLDQNLVRNFHSCCVEPLELEDSELRRLYFHHYKRLVYLHQPADADLADEIAAIGDFLELPVQKIPVGYEILERRLGEVIGKIVSEQEGPHDQEETQH